MNDQDREQVLSQLDSFIRDTVGDDGAGRGRSSVSPSPAPPTDEIDEIFVTVRPDVLARVLSGEQVELLAAGVHPQVGQPLTVRAFGNFGVAEVRWVTLEELNDNVALNLGFASAKKLWGHVRNKLGRTVDRKHDQVAVVRLRALSVEEARTRSKERRLKRERETTERADAGGAD